jgi:hypothetical protein
VRVAKSGGGELSEGLVLLGGWGGVGSLESGLWSLQLVDQHINFLSVKCNTRVDW